MNGNYPTDPVLISSDRTAFFMQQQYALRASRVSSNPIGATAANLQAPVDARYGGEQALAKDAINQTFGNGSQSEAAKTQRQANAFSNGQSENGRQAEDWRAATPPAKKVLQSGPQASEKNALAPKDKLPTKKHTPPKQLQKESAAKFQEFRSRAPNKNAWLPDVSFVDPSANESLDYYCPVACDIDKPVSRACSYANDRDYLEMIS